ncbi:MAG: hypothetical protein MN733_44240, partial [Nitrososphaera sp.]|nr:hypothetical protein [Nitrososphaera sp.]
ARRSHAMALDYENDVVIMFGGYGNGSHLGDTWVLDMEEGVWREMRPDPAPTPRAASSLVYDPGSMRMFLFGGFSFGHSVVSNDTWAYDYPTNSWTDLNPVTAPSERASYGMALDSKRDKLVLFGGFTENGYFNDMWAYSLRENSWKELQILGELPSPRGAMGFAYDESNDSFIMFGGFSDKGFFSDTWIFYPDDNTWERMQPADSPPPIRTRMVYDNSTGKVIFFGGDTISQASDEGSPDPYSKVWQYDLNANTWVELQTANGPPARALNGITHHPTGRSIVVFGGTDTLIDSENFVGNEFSDTWILRLNDDTGPWDLPILLPVGIGAAIAAGFAIASLLKRKKEAGRANQHA